jgi:hypothetical protein
MEVYDMKLKALTLTLIAVMFSITNLSGQDYQYQYFTEGDEFVPFSDYIPRIRLHYYTVPHYLEDYYLLFGMKLHYNENSLRKNIEMLKTGLICKFRHPSLALVSVDTEDEYLKYRKLMFMHINIMIMRNYLKIGVRYDKKTIKFHDVSFAEDIHESLNIARKIYQEALPYWVEAKRYAEEASQIKLTTKLSNIESERYRIITGDLDFNKIINNHISRVDKKQEQLKNFVAATPQ